jgi:hypothetical protein
VRTISTVRLWGNIKPARIGDNPAAQGFHWIYQGSKLLYSEEIGSDFIFSPDNLH